MLLWADKVDPPQLDFMKISLFGKRLHSIQKVHVQTFYDSMAGTKEILKKFGKLILSLFGVSRDFSKIQEPQFVKYLKRSC